MGIVGSIVGGIVGSNSSKKAAKIQQQTADQNRTFAQQTYDKNVGLIQPDINRGTNANTYIDGLLGIGGDPNAANKAWQTFRNSSGYQQQLLEGQNSILGNNAARGTFQSGATAKALAEYSAGLADRSSQNYLNNLMNISNQGIAAKSAALGQGTQLTNNVINANNQAGNAASQNALNQGNIFNSTLDNIGKSLSSSFGF